MEFQNLTRRVEIGANSYLLRTGGQSLVLDTGMHPKQQGLAATPDFSTIPPGTINGIIVTHAHQDHLGSLPVLTQREPQARVFMTPGTAKIADVMLHNSVNVMTRQREEHSAEDLPLFTHRGVDRSRSAWQLCPIGRRFGFDGERSSGEDEPSFEFFSAGHILGAVGVMIRSEGKKVFYTGDVNFENQTLMRGAEFPTEGVDTLIMETTRGDSPTPAGLTRAGEAERLTQAIQAAFDRGGSVTIPIFALGKTQEILALIWEMRLEGKLPRVPIYIGGLSTKLSMIYDAMASDPQRSHPKLRLLDELAPYVLSGKEIFSVPPGKERIFALSSGMMTENTLSNLFARRVLSDPKQNLFFVGYSDPDSPAGRLRATEPGGDVLLDTRQPPLPLRCHVENFNFSAHASRETLLAYAIALRPKKIVLIHGDQPAIDWFQLELHRALPESEIVVPEPGKTIQI
jgi:Cft2 family RNA processing exonuclease